MTEDEEIDFWLQFSANRADLVGARWWNEAAKSGGPGGLAAALLRGSSLQRRDLVQWALVFGTVGLGAAALYGLSNLTGSDDLDDAEIREALELQRREGWDVGGGQARLFLSNATAFDADGGSAWKENVADLATALAPPLRLRPFYVSTLFQALTQPSLRAQMEPVHSTAADVTYQRATALGELFDQGDSSDLALILDLPGEDTVAAAAALSERFWPVFDFGNWPHPRGVVPSHLTLGAALYYSPRFRKSASRLSLNRPPMFVLDANRLNPYGDDPERFDNRYLAQLPSVDNLRALGIRRMMYVRPQGASTTELDDLNDDFVAFEDAGIGVRFVSLGDFTREPGAGGTAYYWGGSPATHILFWPSYGRVLPFPAGPAPLPAPGARGLPPGDRSTTTSLPRTTRFEPRPSVEYRPTRRDTIFSSRTIGGSSGIGKQKPSGFGMVSVRRDGATGAPRAVGDARAVGRSGSFGRYSGSYSG